MKIKEVLKKATNILKCSNVDEAFIKARILLAHALKVEKEYLIIHDEDEMLESLAELYYKNVKEVAKGKPIQYITNNQEFMKMNFYVDENVLIPRQDTEVLVEEVINSCKENKEYKILDLCTGSGIIGISLAKYIKKSNVVCSDISKKALEVAKKNANINKVKNIEFIHSDMFKRIVEKFDIIVSNPPYIKTDIIPNLDKEVQNEPYIALDGGQNGLDFYKVIIDEANRYLNENGILFLEIGFDEKEAVLELINKKGLYKNAYCKKDLYGNDRVIVAFK